MSIPKDEMFLAKIIQNAGNFGFWSCRNSLFKNSSGRRRDDKRAKDISYCCARGAAKLASDTRRTSPEEADGALEDGNDGKKIKPRTRSKPWECWCKPWEYWFEVGQAFYDARRKPF